MKKQIFSLAIILCYGISNLFAQSAVNPQSKSKKRNAIYIEFFGSSGELYDISYDRCFVLAQKSKLSAAIGFQYARGNNFIGTPYDLYALSPQINYLYGQDHHLEIGITVPIDISNVIFHAEFNNLMNAVILHIGYRYQSETGGVFFKGNINPTIKNDFIGDDLSAAYFLLMPGFSVGFTF